MVFLPNIKGGKKGKKETEVILMFRTLIVNENVLILNVFPDKLYN